MSSTSNNENHTTALLLWSTTTGRAKACARRTGRMIRCRGVPVTGCSSLDDFGATPFLNIAQTAADAGVSPPLLVLFVSTTGDGEQCDSVKECWSALLQKSVSKSHFVGVKFVLFALGDRAYGDAFCAAGRKLAARLVQLGATPLCPIGYGDDGTPDGGIFTDLDIWIDKHFLPALHAFKEPPLTDDFVIDDSPKLEPPSYKVTVLPHERDDRDHNGEGNPMLDAKVTSQMKSFFRSLAPITAYDFDTGCSRNSNENGSRLVPLEGRVVSNNRITADSWYQDVRHIRIEVDAKSQRDDGPLRFAGTKPYDAGDVAVIMPQNSPASVQRFLRMLPQHIQSIADHELTIERLSADVTPWPSPCSLRRLLTYCADIGGLPEREFLRSLSVFTDIEGHPAGKDQAEKLVELSESSGSALYADYIIRERRNYADVLYDFDAVRTERPASRNADSTARANTLSLGHLLGLIPPMIPRQFSIASSPSMKGDVSTYFSPNPETSFAVELCVAVVEGKTPLGRTYKGLCSSFLASLNSGNSSESPSSSWEDFPTIRLWIRPGSFGKLPLKVNNGHSDGGTTTFERPVMCIGSGTGIAPLRALMRERFAAMQNASHQHQLEGVPAPDSNILIFGCRKKSADYYYRHEWEQAIDNGSMRLLTAFSQDQRHKVYVQQVLKGADDGLLVARHLLEHGGALYIAGGVKMAGGVKDEVVEILGSILAGGEPEAKLLLKKLHRAGLFSVEAWS